MNRQTLAQNRSAKNFHAVENDRERIGVLARAGVELFTAFRNHRHGAARNRVLNWKHLGTYLSHERHQSATAGDLQLAEDGMKMFFHRFETQAAFIGNLLIAAPIAH
jgi:hypothetical protein